MIVYHCPVRCTGTHTAKPKRGGLCGMGIARPQRPAESGQHRPPTGSPHFVRGGSDRVKRRQMPCTHWTLGQRSPAAAHVSPLMDMTRCRQGSTEREATAKGIQPDPSPHLTVQPRQWCVYGLNPAPVGRTCALRPDDGRSVPNLTLTIRQREVR